MQPRTGRRGGGSRPARIALIIVAAAIPVVIGRVHVYDRSRLKGFCERSTDLYLYSK